MQATRRSPTVQEQFKTLTESTSNKTKAGWAGWKQAMKRMLDDADERPTITPKQKADTAQLRALIDDFIAVREGTKKPSSKSEDASSSASSPSSKDVEKK